MDLEILERQGGKSQETIILLPAAISKQFIKDAVIHDAPTARFLRKLIVLESDVEKPLDFLETHSAIRSESWKNQPVTFVGELGIELPAPLDETGDCGPVPFNGCQRIEHGSRHSSDQRTVSLHFAGMYHQ